MCSDLLFVDVSTPLPYSDYKIIGDVAEIEKVRLEPGIINIPEWVIKSTLSKESANYVSTGFGMGEQALADALRKATDDLQIDVGQIASMIIQLWHPREGLSINKITQLTEYMETLPYSIDVFWGCALNNESNDIKITLIASNI